MINNVLQWMGTTFLLAMYVVMNFFRDLHPLQIVLGFLGGFCYYVWSVRTNNRPQQLVNLAGMLVCGLGFATWLS